MMIQRFFAVLMLFTGLTFGANVWADSSIQMTSANTILMASADGHHNPCAKQNPCGKGKHHNPCAKQNPCGKGKHQNSCAKQNPCSKGKHHNPSTKHNPCGKGGHRNPGAKH